MLIVAHAPLSIDKARRHHPCANPKGAATAPSSQYPAIPKVNATMITVSAAETGISRCPALVISARLSSLARTAITADNNSAPCQILRHYPPLAGVLADLFHANLFHADLFAGLFVGLFADQATPVHAEPSRAKFFRARPHARYHGALNWRQSA